MFRFSTTSKLEKLQLRLTISIALALLVTVFIILAMHNASNILAEHQLQQDAEKMLQGQARKRMKAEVQFLLSGITNQFDEAFRVAIGIADILKTFHESNMPRENVLAVLKGAFKGHPEFLGVYAAFEPNAYDGKDQEYRDQKALGSAPNGRFMPYFNRITDSMRLEVLSGVNDNNVNESGIARNAWYTCPKNTLQPCTLGPISYTAQSRRPLRMLTQAAPIVKDNRFLGMAGVNISLSWITEQMKQLAGDFPQSHALLFNEKGLLVSDSSSQSSPLSEARTLLPEEVVTLMNTSHEGFLEHQGKLYFHAPVTFGALTTPWHLLLEMPQEVFLQNATASEHGFASFLRGMSIKASLVSLIVIVLATTGVTYLSQSIFREVRKLARLILGSAENVSIAAKEIAQGNTELAQRTEHQASGLEELAASAEELSASSKQTSEHAKTLSQVIEDAEQGINEGRQVLGDLTHSVTDLEKSQRRIAEITAMIDEISFQTNLLALNASVEAARAGEHGRSFAVVAQEVRRLAVRAGEMSRDITRIVNVSLGRANENIENIQRTSKVMNDIFNQIDHLTTLSSDIASASVEQSRGINEINTALSQLDEITQQNMTLVEEIANSAAHLRDLSSSMEQSVRSLIVQADEEHPSEGGEKKSSAVIPDRRKKNALPDISPSEWREL